MTMTESQDTNRAVHGCILLIPSDLFAALEREATGHGLSPEVYLLKLLESRVERTTQKGSTGRVE
jgi:hypothetical protein